MLDRIASMSEQAGRVSVAIGSVEEGDAADLTAARAVESGLGPVSVLRAPEELVRALADGDVEAAVRGTLPSHRVLPMLAEATGAISVMRAALMEAGEGRSFWLTPVGIDEGRDMAERWALLQAIIRLASGLGSHPRAAIMSMGRAEDTSRGEAIAVSHRECEALRSAAETEGVEAECVGIQLERAVADFDIVLAPDGITGNLVFRALHLVSGRESWGAVALGLAPLVYVDTSREKTDYLGALHLARTLAGTPAGDALRRD